MPGAGVEPYDCIIARFSGASPPGNCCFTLVCDPDSFDVDLTDVYAGVLHRDDHTLFDTCTGWLLIARLFRSGQSRHQSTPPKHHGCTGLHCSARCRGHAHTTCNNTYKRGHYIKVLNRFPSVPTVSCQSLCNDRTVHALLAENSAG